MSSRAANRLKAYHSLLLVRDLQRRRAEIAARQDAEAAQRSAIESRAARDAALETETLWLSSVTANSDPTIQKYWAEHALDQDRRARQSQRDADAAAQKAEAAKALWSTALAQLDVAGALRRDADQTLTSELEEARLAAQEDRDLERRRRI